MGGDANPFQRLFHRRLRRSIKLLLDDSMAMNPALKLSAQSAVTLEARISAQGMAQASAGDLLSELSKVQIGATAISLQISKIRP